MNVINILKLRGEEINECTGDHDSEIRNYLCCWEKKTCITQIFFSHLIFDSFIAVSLYFLANMRGSSALI